MLLSQNVNGIWEKDKREKIALNQVMNSEISRSKSLLIFTSFYRGKI